MGLMTTFDQRTLETKSFIPLINNIQDQGPVNFAVTFKYI